jgi:hypothetical protein
MKSYMEQDDDGGVIDIRKNRYPYCLVWTPLPLITWLLPFIGHTGICTKDGVIHDFSGSYSVTVDDMAFGEPTKYVKLDIEDKKRWDDCVIQGDSTYGEQCHNLFSNNCHSHCAFVLNQAQHKGGGWNMIYIAWILVIRGRYTGFSGFLKTYAGFFVIMTIFGLIYAFGSGMGKNNG